MNKVYVVSEFGGQYEDKWERIVGVCDTRELAEELKKKIEEDYSGKSCGISPELWYNMYDAVCDWEFENNNYEKEDIDIMLELFPEYTRKQLEQAEMIYNYYDDFVGVFIKEINLYTSKSELNGIND